jgi:mannose-6-phosphate isomerase-like protein (cupin superfamily)
METINGCTVIRHSEAPEPIQVGPAEMDGAYVALVGTFAPGEPAPPFHSHPHTDEAFYVADGEATFRLGDREVRVSAGGLVFVPRGTAHTVWNSGAGPVRGLIIVSPGDAEHVFLPADDADQRGAA